MSRNGTRLFSALTALMIITFSFPIHSKTYRVFFLGGQSNMDGYGYVKDLPPALAQLSNTTMIFQGNSAGDGAVNGGIGTWSILKPGQGIGFKSDGTINTYSNRFGIELSFSERLHELFPNWNIALVKYSRAGSSIDSAAADKFGCWEPDFRDKNGINQYDHFLTAIRSAFSTDDIDHDGIKDTLIPAGIVWMQGESDGVFTEEIALRYKNNLKRMIDLFRAALRSDDLPVIIGRISDSKQDNDGLVWNYGYIIRQAQADFVQQDGYSALVTSTDNYQYSDKYHYNSAGYIDLGKQFADAFRSLTEKTGLSSKGQNSLNR